MTTPPTDDLRARLLACADALDSGDSRNLTVRLLREAAAALSALPAGGREVVAHVVEAPYSGKTVCWHQDVPLGTKLYTTPPPDAAERISFNRSTIGPAPDAAVGAQGVSYIPQLSLRGVLHEALTFVLDQADKDEDPEKWTLTQELRAHIATLATPDDVGARGEYSVAENWRQQFLRVSRENAELRASLAAPAAGKGVDDGLLARAYEVVHHDADCPAIGGNGDGDCRCDAVAFLRDLEAALTRQPVAGGGMVLGANPKCHECGAALLYECAACSATNYPPAASPDYDLALHWIDRYAAGIDYPLQMDRVCEALGLSEPPEGW